MNPCYSSFSCRKHAVFFSLMFTLLGCQEEDADQLYASDDMSVSGQTTTSTTPTKDLGGDTMPDQGGSVAAKDMDSDAKISEEDQGGTLPGKDQGGTPPGQDLGGDAGADMSDQGGMPPAKDMGPSVIDDSTLAMPATLKFPSMNSGRIEDPALVPEAFDSDYYVLKMRGGEHALIEVNGPPGFEPHIEIYYAQGMPPFTMLPGAAAFVMEGTSHHGTATVRAFGNPAILASEYVIKIDDARNLVPGGAFVGGSDYTIEVSSVAPLPLNIGGSLPVTYQSSLPSPGEYAWVDVKIERDSILHLKAETTTPGARPTIVHGGHLEGDTALGLNRRRVGLLFESAESPQAAFLAKPIGDNPFIPGDQSSEHITFGVTDINGWGALPGNPYDVTLTIREYPYPTTLPPAVDELPQNETLAQAQQVTLPALIKGTSQGQRTPVKPTSDYYAFDLTAGDVIYIQVSGDDDKRKRLSAAAVTVLDTQGHVLSYVGRVLNASATVLIYEAPVSQRYILEVAPRLVHSTGSSGMTGFNYLDGSYVVNVQRLGTTKP